MVCPDKLSGQDDLSITCFRRTSRTCSYFCGLCRNPSGILFAHYWWSKSLIFIMHDFEVVGDAKNRGNIFVVPRNYLVLTGKKFERVSKRGLSCRSKM